MIWDNKICKITNSSLMASGKSKSAKEVTSVFGTLVRVAEPEDTGGPTCVRVKTVKKSGKEEDVQEENGVLFWVNKSGFPIDDKTWDRMWDHVARIHPDGYDVIHKVRDKKDLPSVSKNHANLHAIWGLNSKNTLFVYCQ